MRDEPLPQSEIVLYQAEDGRTRIQCRLENETLWLTQAQIAELFQTTPQNVTLHLKAIFAEGELSEAATCKDYLQVRTEGSRQVSRSLRHYRLEAILAVGYRVRSHRGTQFRQWATARLSEYLVKGFTMDDERLKNPPGKGQKDYFDELLERIRDIRSSERRFYQKVLDIYATSVDYTPDAEASQKFFATVQNKMHWATHGHTAAEVIAQRADATKPFMGLLTTRSGGIESFIRREVLPYTPDAWIDPDPKATKVGYEVSFTRHFYQPPQLRTLAEISADILQLEQETEGLLTEITKPIPAK